MWNKIDKTKRIESCSTIAAGLLVFHYFLEVKNAKLESDILFYIAGFVLLIGLFTPILGKVITFLWLKIAEILGYINARIILSLAFYVFLFPISMLKRVFSKDEMKLKAKHKSYFFEVKKKYGKEDLENIW